MWTLRALQRSIFVYGKLQGPQLYRQLSISRSIWFQRQTTGITVAKRTKLFDIDSDKVRDKKAFLEILERFKVGNPSLRGHVEVILTAMNHLEEFQVHRDIEVYKALFQLFPKSKLIPRTLIAAEFQHFPRHQDTAIDLLGHMEEWAIMPDMELKQMILERFGPETHVFRKFGRMMYWMPKFRNASPWPIPRPTPSGALTLAHIAVNQMTSVDPLTIVQEYDCEQLEDALDKTWIVSGQAPKQRELLEDETGEEPISIEGPHLIWLREKVLTYFMLAGRPRPQEEVSINADDYKDLRLTMFGEDPKPSEDLSKLPSVHEMTDKTVYAVCATGTSSRDSLLSWIRFLQKTNPCLHRIPVVFKLKAPSFGLTVVENDSGSETLALEVTKASHKKGNPDGR